jgi:hypothetical protein
MAGVTEELVTMDAVIDAVRVELAAMARKLADEPTSNMVFEVLEVEVELQVVVSTATKVTGTAKGGIELNVLGFGGGEVAGTLTAEHGWSRAATQKVKLKLKPKAKTRTGTADAVDISR